MVTFSDLAGISVDELTLTWNRCWKGYFYEFNYSAAQMEAWLTKGKVDLANSVAMREANGIIGFSLLAVEKGLGWIAGTSIQPEYRGKGLFEPLLRQQLAKAKALNLKQVQLEVLSQNHAQKTYFKVGFEKKRELYVYKYPKSNPITLAIPVQGCYLRSAALEDYFYARKEAVFHPPWQRQEDYLKRFAPLRAWLNYERTAGILMPKEGNFLLDAWITSWEKLDSFVASILNLTNGEFTLTNQPRDMLTLYLSQHGVKPSDIQYEMIHDLHKM